MRTKVTAALLAVSLVLALGACGNDDEPEDVPDTTTTTAAETTTTTAAPAETTTTAASPPATEEPADLGDADETGVSELEDGRHFGYWDSFDIGDTVAFGEFDLAYFLSGAEAEAVAAERGDTVENDYYIVNDNPKLRTLIAHGDTEVTVLADQGGPDTVSTNVADFAVDRHTGSGFWVTIEDGIVTAIEEQFVP
jgi:hypothetical protein